MSKKWKDLTDSEINRLCELFNFPKSFRLPNERKLCDRKFFISIFRKEWKVRAEHLEELLGDYPDHLAGELNRRFEIEFWRPLNELLEQSRKNDDFENFS